MCRVDVYHTIHLSKYDVSALTLMWLRIKWKNKWTQNRKIDQIKITIFQLVAVVVITFYSSSFFLFCFLHMYATNRILFSIEGTRNEFVKKKNKNADDVQIETFYQMSK